MRAVAVLLVLIALAAGPAACALASAEAASRSTGLEQSADHCGSLPQARVAQAPGVDIGIAGEASAYRPPAASARAAAAVPIAPALFTSRARGTPLRV